MKDCSILAEIIGDSQAGTINQVINYLLFHLIYV